MRTRRTVFFSQTVNGLVATLLVAGLGFVLKTSAAPPQLVSKRNPAAAQSAGGNGYSAAPSVAPDGRFVLFVSTANNLTPGGNSRLVANVFVRDRLSNTVTLVSVNTNGTGGGNGNSTPDMISANGRYVLFESDASDLVSGDNNGLTDIFLRDMQAGTTALVSLATNGGPANGGSSNAVMTPDGRYVAFISVASNLVPGDLNGIQDVFVRDMMSGTTVIASVGATGPATVPVMDTPRITPDGRYVAFFSSARGLIPGMTTFPGDIFLRDLVGATTVLVSTNLQPGRLYGEAYDPALSDDGRYVSFVYITNATSAPSFPILRYDTTTGSNTMVFANSLGALDNNFETWGPVMSPDGRYLAYLAATNGYPAIYLWDGQSATNRLVSQDRFGSVLFASNSTPVISPDGRYVAFLSTGTNLTTNVVTFGSHIYLRDMQAGVTELVDVDTNGAGSVDVAGAVPSLSTNGQYVAFASLDGSLVASDNNLALDVFVRDRTNLTTTLISARNPAISAQAGGGASLVSQTALSPDAHWMVFTSRADDLVTNDFNDDSDVFVADLIGGTNILVSVATNGNSGLGGASTSPVMSTNGRYVAFVSAATNLVTNDTIFANKIFYRDLQAGTTVLGSGDSNGVALVNGDCQPPAMSQDGRYLAFSCQNNGAYSIFWRDMTSGQTTQLVAGAQSATGPSLSADGRYACYSYFDSSSHLIVYDSQTSTVVYSNATVFSGVIVPGGTRLVTSQTLLDFISKATVFTFPTGALAGRPVQWSSDGRYCAYVSSSASVGPWDNNSAGDVFLLDLQTSTTTLVSANSNHTATANAFSDSPAVSGDGRFVVFRSYATDVLPGITNVPNLYVFNRLTGSNSLLTVGAEGPNWSYWTAKPAISSNGGVITFPSVRAALVPGSLDLNRVPDVFAEPQSPWPTTDSVGDGIPDAWRAANFGGNGTTTNSQSCAACDPDGDGMSNLQEYLAGTNPNNAASVLRLQVSSLMAGNNVVLTWAAVPGKNYQVQYKNNLTDPSWSILAGGLTVVGYQCSVTVSASLQSRYYQIVVVN